jgi:endonuclease YncB( thermonuclease family)
MGLRWFTAASIALVSALAIAATEDVWAGTVAERARVSAVVDGDTIALVDGRRVRLLQIDTPEPGPASATRGPRVASSVASFRTARR